MQENVQRYRQLQTTAEDKNKDAAAVDGAEAETTARHSPPALTSRSTATSYCNININLPQPLRMHTSACKESVMALVHSDETAYENISQTISYNRNPRCENEQPCDEGRTP